MGNTDALLQAQSQLMARPQYVCVRNSGQAFTGVEPSGRQWFCFGNVHRLAVHVNRKSFCQNGAYKEREIATHLIDP